MILFFIFPSFSHFLNIKTQHYFPLPCLWPVETIFIFFLFTFSLKFNALYLIFQKYLPFTFKNISHLLSFDPWHFTSQSSYVGPTTVLLPNDAFNLLTFPHLFSNFFENTIFQKLIFLGISVHIYKYSNQ